MAGSLLRKNDVTASLDYAKRSVALRQSLASASPRDRDAQKDLADAYRILGQIFEQTQIWAAAIDSYQKGLPILESLAAQMPADGELKRMRMIAYAELGDMQFIADAHAKHRNPEAIANLRRAYDLADAAVAADPANAEAVSDLVAIAIRLGSSLNRMGHGAEGGGLLQRAVNAASELVERDPQSGEDRLNLSMAHASFARYLADAGNNRQAIEQRQMAADIFKDLTAARPDDSKVLLSQVWNWKRLGDLLAKQGNWAGARANYALGRQVAQELAPGNHAFADIFADIQQAEGTAAHALQTRP
jgi:tetratricopeptide (TPR) repeat protein